MQKERGKDRRSTANECNVMCGINGRAAWGSDEVVAAAIVWDLFSRLMAVVGGEQRRQGLPLGWIGQPSAVASWLANNAGLRRPWRRSGMVGTSKLRDLCISTRT